MKQLRTPLSQVKGLGSAKEGTSHFWAQRVSAIAMVPLVIWFCLAIASLPDMSFEALRLWLANPVSAVLLLLFIATGFHHGKLGLQVVIEDYVHVHGIRTALIILVTLLAWTLTALGVFSVLRLALAS